jgi:hypothetical protein
LNLFLIPIPVLAVHAQFFPETSQVAGAKNGKHVQIKIRPILTKRVNEEVLLID